MQLPSDSTTAAGRSATGRVTRLDSPAALDVLACVRSLTVASRHVLARLADPGARVRLGRVGDRCAQALEELERALAGVAPSALTRPAAVGMRRAPHGLGSGIEGGGVGADLCLLLELDVLAARLQARIEGLLAHEVPPALRETLGKLSAVVREIRAEYELYAA